MREGSRHVGSAQRECAPPPNTGIARAPNRQSGNVQHRDDNWWGKEGWEEEVVEQVILQAGRQGWEVGGWGQACVCVRAVGNVWVGKVCGR